MCRFTKILVLKYSNTLKDSLSEKKAPQDTSLPSRLRALLLESMKECGNKEHQASNTFELMILMGYALYSLLLPVVVVVFLIGRTG